MGQNLGALDGWKGYYIKPHEFKKVTSTPDDPQIEEGVLYFKQIDANNNGWFAKTKKNGQIVEVQLA